MYNTPSPPTPHLLPLVRTMMAMDWYSWLSNTDLDPTLVYEYGRTFTYNQLQQGDTTHFNHEFLQSMGISVAKHRLEILKVARKEVGGTPKNSLSRLVFAISKAKKLLTKSIGKCLPHKGSANTLRPNPSLFQSQWTGTALRKNRASGENKKAKVTTMMKSGPLDRKGQQRFDSPKRVISISGPLDRTMMKSGPLDRKEQQRFGCPKRVISMSGPLDRKVKENLIFTYSSPVVTTPHTTFSGPLDALGLSPVVGTPYNKVKISSNNGRVPSLWSLMFQDMKPT